MLMLWCSYVALSIFLVAFEIEKLTNFTWNNQNGEIENFRLRDRTYVHWRELGVNLGRNMEELRELKKKCDDNKECWDDVMYNCKRVHSLLSHMGRAVPFVA